MRRITLPLTLLALLCTTAAHAGEADLQQAIDDLSSQSADKQRMDREDAAKVELSQIGGWLAEATDALKQEKEPLCRRLLDRVRAQLKLVDQLITLSQLKAELRGAQQRVEAARKANASSRESLQKKTIQIEALKLKSK